MSRDASYAVVTPVRNEAREPPAARASLLGSRLTPPAAWMIVDNGSTDETPADRAASSHSEHSLDPCSCRSSAGSPGSRRADRARVRGRARRARAAARRRREARRRRLVRRRTTSSGCWRAFASRPALGIASGTCHRARGGEWRQRHVTGIDRLGRVARATGARASRRSCRSSSGWAGTASTSSGRTRGAGGRAHSGLPFRHHRREGERDGARHRARLAQGHAARYLGYRPWYLVLRAVWQARREPAALAMIWGYTQAAVNREPQCADAAARRYLRRQQSLRRLPSRAAEAVGRRRRLVV